MPDEEIDKLIQDAASQHHPPYDDKAWERMEALLDKHLPQKKDRRKYIFFLLLFLLLGGGIFFVTQKKSDQNKTSIASKINEIKPSNTAAPDLPNTNTVAANNKTINHPLLPNKKSKITINYTDEGLEKITENKINSYIQKSRTAIKVKKPAPSALDVDKPAIQKQENSINADKENTTPATEISTPDDLVINQGKETGVTKQDAVAAKIDTLKINTEAAINKTVKNTDTALSTKKKKGSKNFADKFAITISAGADVSYIAVNNAGKLKTFYGAGVKYTIAKRFKVSAGLYIFKKIYSATPAQYKFSGYVNPALVKINADCKIYEIPLTIYYNFKQKKNHNWFTGIGFSSYLMKKETYNYQYKNPAGQSWNYVHTYNNKNNNYFSVLTLSGGYQYKLSNRFNLIAEPYLKLPLSGIGEGKVKLNSTGILFTAAIKPFVKTKK